MATSSKALRRRSLPHVTVPNGTGFQPFHKQPRIASPDRASSIEGIRNRTHRPRVRINEATSHTFVRSAYLRHEHLFYTPVDTTPSDSILSLLVRIKGQLCSRSHPNQSSSGPPKPFAAIPGSAALNSLPQVHWEHDCTDRHVHFAGKRIDLRDRIHGCRTCPILEKYTTTNAGSRLC